MTPADRQATELYAEALESEFGENTIMLFTARDLDDVDGYRFYSDKNAVLYRELSEVEVALKTGRIPASA
jgi:hypothetical protein